MSIGDINSDKKGTGARYNEGKAPMDLVPISILAQHWYKRLGMTPEVHALVCLGGYQESGMVDDLYTALSVLGIGTFREAAHVFKYGLGKYAPWNWAKGMPWSVPLACAVRHLLDILEKGETLDAESGRHHHGHVACNILMLIHYHAFYPEGNDLPPPEYFKLAHDTAGKAS